MVPQASGGNDSETFVLAFRRPSLAIGEVSPLRVEVPPQVHVDLWWSDVRQAVRA